LGRLLLTRSNPADNSVRLVSVWFRKPNRISDIAVGLERRG